MNVSRFITKIIPNYEVYDVKEWLEKLKIDIYVRASDKHEMRCCRCSTPLEGYHSRYPIKLQHLPLFNFETFIHLQRCKGYCSKCKKHRSEQLDFISDETPHQTAEYSWWLGRLCEITTIKQASKFCNMSEMTLWRTDFKRMKKLFQFYKIPKVKRISVDEVYAQKYRKGFRHRSRADCFFTVICDLDTRRVIWVSEGRSQMALAEFFQCYGEDGCKEIEVVVADQFEGYKTASEAYCPKATFVWDRFHLVQNMEEAINETRKEIYNELPRESETKRLARGKWKYVFLQRANRRSPEDREHMEEVFMRNEKFLKLELIKEKFLTFFECETDLQGEFALSDIESWIKISQFTTLQKWFDNLKVGWKTLKNWFKARLTTSLSEGHNNVIKTLKRRAYGYKNMSYFKLKILQTCGYLNSKYIPMNFQQLQQIC